MELVDITTTIARAGEVELWRCSDAQLAEFLPIMNTAVHALEALRIGLLQEIDARGVTAGHAKPGGDNPYADTPSWMSLTSVISSGVARKLHRLAAALTRHPDVDAAHKDGRINTDDAFLICRTLDRPPVTIPAEALPDVRDYLLQAADGGDTRRLRHCIAKLATVFPPDDGVPPAEYQAGNEFWASPVGGRVVVKGEFDTETGNMLLAALSPLSKPFGDNDSRLPAQRRADAFAEILRRYLDSGQSPADGGDRPHLHLHVNARDLRTEPETTCPTHGHQTSTDAPEPEPDEPSVSEPAAAGADSAPAPAGGNLFAELLRKARGPWLPWTGPISFESSRRIACDCVLTPIVLDDNDAPLNLGRTNRLVSRKLRRAVLARDHGCAFPSCGRPAEWCQAHHAVHWIDGGPTDLDNLVLLCGFHHRLIHHSDWEVVMGNDRHPWFIPPAHQDPTRTPIPSNARAPGRASPAA